MAITNVSPNPFFGSIIPSQQQQASGGNYIDFTAATGGNFAQQYLPEIYEQEVERYGNRTLSGFLRMVGAEMPMTSDQVVWSEQNRLHIAYDDVAVGGENLLTIPVNAGTIQNVISAKSTIVAVNKTDGTELKCYVQVSDLATGALTVYPYTQNTFNYATPVAGEVSWGTGTDVKIFVYGSEFEKGSNDDSLVSVEPQFTQYSNKPIIIRSKYKVDGSDMAQIGWVEVATEDGTSGYLWYLKAESETRLRFEDYLEMSVVEGELFAGTGAPTYVEGTQGLFAAIEERGNLVSGFTATATTNVERLTEFDAILKNLDTQGAIEENMLFLSRQMSLDFDDMLASLNGGNAGAGSAYGLFENSEDMALNLGFSGFRRGSYDFYKTDWKYLNDASTRGGAGINAIDGVLVPAGTSTVYDQILGTNIRRPFLHTRYRASQADDRRMKNWVTGSAGGAFTSGEDSMSVHFLSERCLCVQGANNFVLFKAA